MESLTVSQLASILRVNEHTVNIMVHTGVIPHGYIQDKTSNSAILRFNTGVITGWLKQGPVLMVDEKAYLEELRNYYETNFPDAIKAIRELDSRLTIKGPKLYSLSKVKNKRNGFLYYVRYIENGKLIPSRWCTHTNDLASAEQFARDNRERIINEYKNKKNHGIYAILGNYYKENSPYLENEKNRRRNISALTRKKYDNYINRILIPFLRKQKIKEFEDLTPPVITELQDYLLEKGNKPQTINRFLGCFKAILNHLVMHGKLKENVFDKVLMLKAKRQDYRMRGCYDVNAIKGIFNKPWEDGLSYLLCLIIYTTGMRNSEIEKMQVKDLIKISGYNFINIPASKTENGVRIVPLHEFVYKCLVNYITQTGKGEHDYIFSKEGRQIQSVVYRKANEDMIKILKLDTKEAEGISFYSGRHFWKTLMSAEDLGSIEEYFMGHKVSRDVAKLYNHLDKQGRKKIVGKAKEVFKILDRYILG
jgi:site-specific recombinase XerD